MAEKQITLPHNFTPRDYQLPILRALDRDGYKRAIATWHRRSGKDLTFINYTFKKMFEKVGAYYYFFPTYAQGKKVLWEGMDREGIKFMDHLPKSLRKTTNNQEMVIETINGSIFRVVGTDKVDCYDSKTEILTDEGWKYFKDLTKLESVATLTKEGFLEYNKPDRYIEKNYIGPMYEIKSTSLDLLVTPNHKFYLKSAKGKYKFREIKDVTGDNDKIPATSDWVGEDKDTFVLPEINRDKNDRSKNNNQTFDMKDWCRFIGIYVSEGSVTNSGRGNYIVNITQAEGIKGGLKGNVKEEIENLLNRMGLKFNYDGHSFVIHNKQLYEYLKKLGKSHDKYVPLELMNLSKPYLKEIVDWMILGDGTISKAGQRVYYSVSKSLMDDFQELIIKLGYSGSIKVKKQKPSFIRGRKISGGSIYYLIIRTSKFNYLKSSKKTYIRKKPYVGKIYCVDVKNHVVKVRRNGFVAWSGNSVVGTNPIGCVFSEYSLQDPRAWDFIRPILAENGGWALFNMTPRGKNHGYTLYEYARKDPTWYSEVLTVDDTKAIPKEVLEQEFKEIMDKNGEDSLYQQEYYCSFEAPIQGAYYAKQMMDADAEGRITKVPYEPTVPVNTYWDLGIGDSTAIWFLQNVGQEIRVIDYYENSGEGLPHYAKVLKEKKYLYGKNYAPHDIQVRELTTGKSRLETSKRLGLDFRVIENLSVEDGIEAARNMIPKCWFDEDNCANGISALRSYHKEWDDKNQTYKSHPKHDWASHGADAFRYASIANKKTRKRGEFPEEHIFSKGGFY